MPPSSHAFNHVVVSGSLSEASSQSLHLQLSSEQLRMAAAILESLQSGTAEPAGEAGQEKRAAAYQTASCE